MAPSDSQTGSASADHAKGAGSAGAPPVIIKKYANRRLYNTARSSYVTLDDLSQMVRAGEEFQVFDAKTGEEITRSVLTQIIFDQEAKGQKMLPTNFLRQLIRLYGDAMQGIVPGYLDASMDAFARNQERIRASMGGGNAFATFEAMTRSYMEWFEQAMRMFQTFGGQRPPEAAEKRPPATKGGAKDDASGPAADLAVMQAQLAEMKAQLDRMSVVASEAAGGASPPEKPAGAPSADAPSEPHAGDVAETASETAANTDSETATQTAAETASETAPAPAAEQAKSGSTGG